jgi:hypothetical protein
VGGMTDLDEANQLIGTADVAKLYRVSTETVRRWRKQNLLPAPVVDRKYAPKWRRGDLVKGKKA